MALKLSEKPLIREVLESIPHSDISLIAQQINLTYLSSLLMHIAEEAESSRHIQFYLLWTKALLFNHGSHLKAESKRYLPILNLLIKNLTRKSEDLGKICDHNKYSIKYLLALGKSKRKTKSMEVDNQSDEELEDIGKNINSAEDIDSDVDMEELAAKWSDE